MSSTLGFNVSVLTQDEKPRIRTMAAAGNMKTIRDDHAELCSAGPERKRVWKAIRIIIMTQAQYRRHSKGTHETPTYRTRRSAAFGAATIKQSNVSFTGARPTVTEPAILG
jgi:hypothetical protein